MPRQLYEEIRYSSCPHILSNLFSQNDTGLSNQFDTVHVSILLEHTMNSNPLYFFESSCCSVRSKNDEDDQRLVTRKYEVLQGIEVGIFNIP